jgi:L-ascorbate metabolism protein UlaG (beta-lactamase superfamily)
MRALRLLRYVFQDVGRPIAPAKHHPQPANWALDDLSAAWVGHATVLINFRGFNIITDPVFSARAGVRVWPFTIGPKRHMAPALKPRELPPLDLVLLSHAHMDHLDKRSLRSLPRSASVVTACGTADLLRWMRYRQVTELGWDESITVRGRAGEVTMTAFGLRHWGARYPWETHRSYNAYILEREGLRICFAGDTARTDARRLGSRGPIDLMIVPIAAYHPWITNHCTPEEAVAMADEAGARYIMPVHHETFKLSWEPMDEPLRRFRAALAHQPERMAIDEFSLRARHGDLCRAEEVHE